jgi:hypothetical protein
MQKVHKVQEGSAPPPFLHFLHFLQAGVATTGRAMSEATKPLSAARERLPNRRAHTLLNIEAGGFRYVAGVGHYDDGRLAEIFLNADKGGTAIDDAARDSAVVASLALQHGVDPDMLRRALMRNGNGAASGPLGTLLDLLASETEP